MEAKYCYFALIFSTLKPEDVTDFCGDSFSCKYDYSVTLNSEYARWSKYYENQLMYIRENQLKTSKFCLISLQFLLEFCVQTCDNHGTMFCSSHFLWSFDDPYSWT